MYVCTYLQFNWLYFRAHLLTCSPITIEAKTIRSTYSRVKQDEGTINNVVFIFIYLLIGE